MPKPMRACVNCGDEFPAFPKNRKYCLACQCLRDLNFRRGTAVKCDTCGDMYYPIRTSYTSCYKCSDWRGGVRDTYPKCTRCGQQHRTAPGVEKTCVACVQSSKDMQHRYHLTLRKIIAERIAQKETP